MVSSFTEKNYALEVILSEANGHRSRETVTVVSGQNLKAGAVLGKITSGGKYAICDNHTPASDGSQNAAAVLLEDCDASGGDKTALALVRDAEVKVGLLNYVASATGGEKTSANAALATNSRIIVR